MATNNAINLSQSGITVYDGAGTFSGRTLQSGTNVSITNPDGIAGNPLIAVTGIVTWSEVTGTSQAMSVDNGYIVNNASLVTLTLPATATIGQTLEVLWKGAGGWKIAQNASQQIRIGILTSTSGTGGSIASSNSGDCIRLKCIVAGASTIWEAASGWGNITVV